MYFAQKCISPYSWPLSPVVAMCTLLGFLLNMSLSSLSPSITVSDAIFLHLKVPPPPSPCPRLHQPAI